LQNFTEKYEAPCQSSFSSDSLNDDFTWRDAFVFVLISIVDY
jgi:hypothetical protein